MQAEQPTRDERPFCDATADSGCPGLPLRCDMPRGHGGNRHAERWVASWGKDGSDVRWYIGSKGGRDFYRGDVREAGHVG